MRAALARILNIPGSTAGVGAVVGLTPSARGAIPPEPIPDPLRVIRDAGGWLANAWAPPYRKAFAEARREEVRNFVFPPQYWRELEPTADLTDYGTPTVGPYVGNLNAAYVDPLRSPTTCEFGLASRTYPTPGFPGTEADPFPGWRGEVIDGYWRDLYFAQRRLMYELPKREVYEKRRIFIRPLFAFVEGQVMANASFRGVKSWFALCLWPYLYRSEDGTPADATYLNTRYTPGQLSRLELPPAQTSNWACTANVKTLRGMTHASAFGNRNNCNRLLLRVTSPPSRGVYFGRNDEVSVMHRETIRLFQAKAKNE